jgi:hypothetical protein
MAVQRSEEIEAGRRRHGRGRFELLLALLLPLALVAVVGLRAIAAGWHRPPPAIPAPPPRSGAGLVADPAHHVLVLFGGHGLDGDLDDTWTWDGTTWTRQNPPNSPVAQENPRLVYDGTRGRVLLIGGALRFGEQMRPLETEMWIWDGHTWQPDASVSPPTGDINDDAVAWDPAHADIVLVASTITSSFRTLPLPTSTVHSSPAPHPAVRSGTPPPPPQWWSPPTGERVPIDVRTLLHTWTWDGAAWTDHGQTSMPGGFDVTMMAADLASGRVDLLARQDPPLCPVPTGDAPFRVWPQANVAPHPEALPPECPAPPSLPDHACTGTGTDLGTEQWAWDGAAWHQVASRGLPCGFGGSDLLTDPSTRHLLLRSGDGFLRWDGTKWRATHAVDAFRGRSDAAIAADPDTHEIVLFGGQRVGRPGNDLWTWDGRGWTQRGGTSPPTPTPTPTGQPGWTGLTSPQQARPRAGGRRP